MYKLILSFFKSAYILVKDRPQKVVSTGGYISIPVCMAAFILRIPIEIYELNATPGKATTLLSKIASKIHVCFTNTRNYFPPKKCTLATYPIRFIKNQSETTTIRTKYNFCPTKKTVLVLGGSQGSLAINTLVKKWIKKNSHLHNKFQIIHQTGDRDTTDWEAFYKKNKLPAIHFDFKHDIKKYYQAADIVICRAGAGTLFENIFFNKKFITIPLETAATAHQLDNAQEIVKSHPHLATIIRQKEAEHNSTLFF